MSDSHGKAAASDRTTVRPPFDPEQFARECDSKVSLEPIPPSSRPTLPPGALGEAAGESENHAVRTSDVPVLAVARDDLEWFDLTPAARDLLRMVNGQDAVDAIASHARLTVPEAEVVLERLRRDGLVTWR
jgi:hypothetical protein